MDIKTIADRFDAHSGEVLTALRGVKSAGEETAARLAELEQKSVREGSDGIDTKSIGQTVTESPEFKSLAAARGGKARINLKTVITSATGSGASLATSMRVTAPDMLQQRRLRVRDLLSVGRTTSGSIEYPRQTLRTNNAAPQAGEGELKAESALAFEMVTAPVRTFAHFIPASTQVLDDAPQLASLIDSELRYGLADLEERQVLLGGGTGADLHGIYPQASAFTPAFLMPSPTRIDVLLIALAQLEAADFEPDGIVINGSDWARILATKDSAGAYLGDGPFNGEQVSRLWNLPVVTSSTMAAGTFLVGAFKRGAHIWDRQDATVEISTEDSDNFRRNLVTIRGEARLALAVTRPGAFVKGTFAAAITASTGT